MIQPKKRKIAFFSFVSLLCLLSSCSFPQPRVCIKEGQSYCVTSDWAYLTTWDACYRRGLSCMEGECWEYAIEEFKRAIDRRFIDRRNVRAYGLHFRDEYFPHRELGICYFQLGNIDEALKELALSMSQTSSARAKYYLNQVRRADLLAKSKDKAPPTIHMEFLQEEYITNQTPFQIKGTVEDDRFVAAVSANGNPSFIELAQPALPFSFSVDLKEGWNIIDITATDLVNHKDQRSLRVYLDQQGPLVMLNPIREEVHPKKNQTGDPGHIILFALVYDQTGLVSFYLNDQEVPRLGLDRLCLIEKSIFTSQGQETVSFRTQDQAGNITKGEILLHPGRRRLRHAWQVAYADSGHPIPCPRVTAESSEDEPIRFHFLYPLQEEFTTCYQDIFLEGEIEAQNGIKKVELNGRELAHINQIAAYEKENRVRLKEKLQEQYQNPEKVMETIHSILKMNKGYYLNQRIFLEKEFTILDLTVEDNQGHKKTKQFRIKKIPREEIFHSEERMTLSIIPFDMERPGGYDRDQQKYIYSKLQKCFVQQGRFNFLEEEKLPWDLIGSACIAGKLCEEKVIQQIGELTPAEGVICGDIHRWQDGIEIKAVFREVEKGETRLFHDVFTPVDTAQNLTTVIAGLAMKFSDSFPICEGIIIDKEKSIIQVDIGMEKGLFPGMRYNIFEDEREILDKASIKKVKRKVSEAEVLEQEQGEQIREGHKVRTR